MPQNYPLRHRKPWTDNELKIVLKSNSSLSALAHRLGRTDGSVNTIRRKAEMIIQKKRYWGKDAILNRIRVILFKKYKRLH